MFQAFIRNQNWLVIVTENGLIGKDPDAGKDWRQEKKGTTEDEMVRWTSDSMDMSLSKLWKLVKDREAWGAAVHGVSKSWTWLSDWITPVFIILGCHNKIPQRGWLKQQICRLENSRSKWGWFCSWWGLSSWLAEGHPLTWPFLGAVLKNKI